MSQQNSAHPDENCRAGRQGVKVITTAIVAAEVAFWVVLLAGLLLRYIVRAQRLSSLVLACIPLVDLALIGFVAADLARGAEPSTGWPPCTWDSPWPSATPPSAGRTAGSTTY